MLDGGGIPRIRTETQVYRNMVAPDKAEVRQVDEMGTWIVTDAHCILVLCSRARHPRDPLPDLILEEQSRTDQPNPSRNPLSLIPDYWYSCWEGCYGDQDVIALTHVCRAWRELFISRSSLWTNLECKNADKTLVYLERSKSSPTINLSLRVYFKSSPTNPFFQITPLNIRRLKFLSIRGTPEPLHDVVNHLSHPAPLLEDMSINGCCLRRPDGDLILTPTLFSADLPLLRRLSLENVYTKLPRRNMVNLHQQRFGSLFTFCTFSWTFLALRPSLSPLFGHLFVAEGP